MPWSSKYIYNAYVSTCNTYGTYNSSLVLFLFLAGVVCLLVSYLGTCRTEMFLRIIDGNSMAVIYKIQLIILMFGINYWMFLLTWTQSYWEEKYTFFLIFALFILQYLNLLFCFWEVLEAWYLIAGLLS